MKQIDDDGKKYNISKLAFDRWGSTKIMQELQNIGFEEEKDGHAQRHLVDWGQGFASMSPATKEIEKMIMSKEIAHNNNPVLNWMISNVAIKFDAAGNLKPNKAESTDRIDGVISLIMAMGCATKYPDMISVYENKEILTI